METTAPTEQQPARKTKTIWRPDGLPDEPRKYGKQSQFLESPEDIVGIYGSKWNGKSELLIMDCLRPEKYRNPRWHGVIFRREYKRLTELIDRAHYWINKLPHLKATWKGSPDFKFVFPSRAWLAFHNLQHLGDEEQYQGWEIGDLKFDQLDEFLEPQYNYLMLQNRCGDPNFHCTTKWSANPLGVGGVWIGKRYVRKYEAGKPHAIITKINGKEYVKTFRWIHVKVHDNPMAVRNPGYIATLASEPDPRRRKAFFEGDPNVAMGQFFDGFDYENEVIDPFKIPETWELICSIDPGWGGTCAGSLLAQDYEGRIYRIAEYHGVKRNPEQNAKGLKEMVTTNVYTGGRWPSMFPSGKDAFAQKDRQAIIASSKTFAAVFEDYGMMLTPAITDRHNGWGTMKSLMPGRFFVFRNFNNNFLEELLEVETDPDDIDDIKGKGNDPNISDHHLDSTRYGEMAIFKPQPKPEDNIPAWMREEMERNERESPLSGVGDP